MRESRAGEKQDHPHGSRHPYALDVKSLLEVTHVRLILIPTSIKTNMLFDKPICYKIFTGFLPAGLHLAKPMLWWVKCFKISSLLSRTWSTSTPDRNYLGFP